MGHIRQVASVADSRDMTRWLTILESDDILDEPEMSFEIKLINDDKLMKLSKPFRRNSDNMSDREQREFRKVFALHVVRNWRGVTVGNVRRLCQVFLENPDLISCEDGNSQWVFDTDDLEMIAEHMNVLRFNDMVSSCLELEEFAREAMEKEKKERKSTLDSASAG